MLRAGEEGRKEEGKEEEKGKRGEGEGEGERLLFWLLEVFLGIKYEVKMSDAPFW